ncbi:MAG: hypothetical protein ACK4WB_03255 [Desulfatiglandales bacterium]
MSLGKREIRGSELEKELNYILGRYPDEFGLIPDEMGYVSLKELLAVLSELGKGVTKNDINELLLRGGAFEIKGNRIRAKEIFFSRESIPNDLLPPTLYTFIRRRAHESVFREGIRYLDQMVPLFRDRESALKIGNRKTQGPVILELSTKAFRGAKTQVFALGNMLMADYIPKDSIVGPRPEAKDTKERSKVREVGHQELPGSVVLRPEGRPFQRVPKGKKPKGWKESIRKFRKR